MSSIAFPNFETWKQHICSQMEEALTTSLPGLHAHPSRLHRAMHYAVFSGGKRIRPLFAFAAGELSGADTSLESALCHTAVAIELIHTYSLVHDDLPSMDNAELRRGKLTVHKAFDDATAILAGNALATAAFEIVSAPYLFDDPHCQLAVLHYLAKAVGSDGLCAGQSLDICSVGQHLPLPQLEAMHTLKTGKLLEAAIVLGARCGAPLSVNQQKSLTDFAQCIGLLFQVIDDILDAESETLTLEKTSGSDAFSVKPTYVSCLGIQGAKEKAQALHKQAIDALKSCAAQAHHLQAMTEYIAKRSF